MRGTLQSGYRGCERFGTRRNVGRRHLTITLRFGPDDLLRCRFALSPLWETLAAVRQVIEPGRHARLLPWLRSIQENVTGLDLTALAAVQPTPGYTPDFLTPPPGSPLADVEQELARVRATPLDRVAFELGRALADRDGPLPPELAFLGDDPAAAVERLVRDLRESWHVLVEPLWPRLRDLLDADIAFHARRLADGGLERLFAELHPRVRFGGDTLRVASHVPDHRDLDGAGLVLMPSAFSWPGVVVVLDAPWQPTLIYPARGVAALWSAPAGGPPGLARLLGRTRAAILTGLAEPASTSTLARRYELSPGTISEHLAALRDAGLVTPRRDRRSVLYERTPLGIALAKGPGAGPPAGRPAASHAPSAVNG